MGVTEVETLGGEKIEVIKAGSCITIRSSAGTANVILLDVGATNGVIWRRMRSVAQPRSILQDFQTAC